MVTAPVAQEPRFPPVPPPRSPFFPRLRDHCLSLPGAWVDYPWGETVFKVGKKMFASGWQAEAGELTTTVKATLDDQAALMQIPGVARVGYIGKHGWVTLTISDEASLAFALDLVSASYELVVHPPKKARARSKA